MIPTEDKIAQLERILSGRTLHGSESLRAFLRFVVEQSVEGEEHQLKEYIIATEVFGRGSDFDPRIDSVVRVQAGRLRNKLQEYYATEGKGDSIVIDLPKGQYTPVFFPAQKTEDHSGNGVNSQPSKSLQTSAVETVSATAGLGLNEFALAPVEPAVSTPHQLPKITRRRWRMAAAFFSIATVVFGAMAFNYRAKNLELLESLGGIALGEISLIDRRGVDPLWGDFLRSTEPVLIVYSNTLFRGTPDTGMRSLKSLDSPGSSLGSPMIPQSEIEQSKEPIIEHYTGIGEVMGAYFLGDFMARVRHPSRVKRSLLLTWEDLKTENIVVLGSPAENLFLRDLPQKQDLVFKQMPDESGKLDFGVLVNDPKPGEQQKYFAKQDGPSRSQITEDYAVVSLLQGVSGQKRLLILAGITTHGTQAAAEYVTKPEYINELINRLNIASPGAPPKLPMNYQVLVKVKVNGGVPVQVSYVTHHVLGQ
ncbi:MAG: hypothetical protein SF097_04985 [Acidobacteriota bacterium]|nr:hypothetical protein [Acidobacteriota bacterium]